MVTRRVYYQKQLIQDSAGGNSHTGWIHFINLVIVGMQRGISQHAFLKVRIISCFTVKYSQQLKKRSETESAAGRYLEPVSGTQQNTLRSRSSRTLRLDSGADTRPHFPARGGRREGTGSRSGIDLLTARLRIFPGTETRRHSAFPGTNNTSQMKRAPHPLGARVHTLVHGHVLDDGAERKGQRHVGRPAEATLEDGAAVWKAETTRWKFSSGLESVWRLWSSASALASLHRAARWRSWRAQSVTAWQRCCVRRTFHLRSSLWCDR